MTILLSRPIVPIASEEDARATYSRFRPYLEDGADAHPLVVYVVEKSGGGIDKAGVEQRTEMAESAFETFRSLAAADGVDVDCEVYYGTDVAETIIEAAVREEASAIVFASRGGGRLLDFLSGSVRTKLLSDGRKPVVVLPSDE